MDTLNTASLEMLLAALALVFPIANRFVEFTVKPLVKQAFNQFPLPAFLYRIVMTIAAIVVGMVLYFQTPNLATVFDETLFAPIVDYNALVKAFFAGIMIWVGADFIRPLFNVLNLINASVDNLRAAQEATNRAVEKFDQEAAIITQSAQDAIARHTNRG